VDPILAVQGLRAALTACGVPVVAVSPLIGGLAVKGPTAKIMSELGLDTTPRAIADHYAGLLDGFVIDEADAAWEFRCGVPACVMPTLMNDDARRRGLAGGVLEFARRLARGSTPP
jgi:LPPG:FO 2-phospho-L-lactate transferase